jgi:hypothetical protein
MKRGIYRVENVRRDAQDLPRPSPLAADTYDNSIRFTHASRVVSAITLRAAVGAKAWNL